MFKHMILHLLMMAVEYNIVNQKKNQNDFQCITNIFSQKTKALKVKI